MKGLHRIMPLHRFIAAMLINLLNLQAHFARSEFHFASKHATAWHPPKR
jgi:hypothetical protein